MRKGKVIRQKREPGGYTEWEEKVQDELKRVGRTKRCGQKRPESVGAKTTSQGKIRNQENGTPENQKGNRPIKISGVVGGTGRVKENRQRSCSRGTWKWSAEKGGEKEKSGEGFQASQG